MSESRLQLDENDIEFLAALCVEEILRCRCEQNDMRHLDDVAKSKRREKKATRLLEDFTETLNELDEDDGMEGRPELN